MITCDTCGNPFQAGAVCPFCERPVSAAARASVGGGSLQLLMLKEGMPTRHEAEDRFWREWNRLLLGDARAVVIVHGYGSTGVGGHVRHWVRKTLAGLAASGSVLQVIHGESFPAEPERRSLQKRFPGLLRQIPPGGNEGVTLVLL